MDLLGLFAGQLQYSRETPESMALVVHARSLVESRFGSEVGAPSPSDLADWILQVSGLKSEFTNGHLTQELIKDLVVAKYRSITDLKSLWYDRPRLRVIPPSSIFRAGVSYNYEPHRDTWYGAPQEQINHWIAVSNVSTESTFFIAPTLFATEIRNTSGDFDLMEWRTIHRPLASAQIGVEDRPHPRPLVQIPEQNRIRQVLAVGCDVAFSGHHIHGSSPNNTSGVRLSIDFRVSAPEWRPKAPRNIDSEASGDYYSEMISLSALAEGV